MMQNNILQNFLSVLLTLVTFFLLLFIYTAIAGPIPFSINSVTTTKSDAFSVSGEGRVEAKPDSATIRLGVVAKGATEEVAKNNMNTSINRVLGALKDLGISEDKIKTENFNIYPEYNSVRAPVTADSPGPDQNQIAGYTGNTNLSITVETAELANQVLDAGVEAGANQVGGIDFQVKDKTESMNKARELAVADAKKKAEEIIDDGIKKLGSLTHGAEDLVQNGKDMIEEGVSKVKKAVK